MKSHRGTPKNSSGSGQGLPREGRVQDGNNNDNNVIDLPNHIVAVQVNNLMWVGFICKVRWDILIG